MSDALARLLLKEEIEQFLYHEAELLDERRYEEWLALFAEDAQYFMPMRRNVPHTELDREFTREGLDVNWFDEGKDTLGRRVKQILTGVHWAEEPPSRICHMISNVRILVLDDATASVDATTEARIRDGLREVMRGRTTIIIAHRLSTIQLADEVVVLEHGRVAARGTQEELLEGNAVYRELHEHGLLEGLLEEKIA